MQEQKYPTKYRCGAMDTNTQNKYAFTTTDPVSHPGMYTNI